MPTTSNFGWTTPADTDLVKDGALAIRTLGNGIDTSMAQLKGGTTGQVLSKTSNTDMAFTWVTQDDANAIQNAIVDAKGDLISATAADTPARLAVGTNGQVLTADSSTATGLKWATPSAGTTVKLYTATPASDFTTSSTTFVDATGWTITFTPTTATNKIKFTFDGAIACTGDVGLRLLLDGSSIGIRNFIANDEGKTIIGYTTDLSAASHTIKLQVRSNGGVSSSIYGTTAGYFSSLSVLEVN